MDFRPQIFSGRNEMMCENLNATVSWRHLCKNPDVLDDAISNLSVSQILKYV